MYAARTKMCEKKLKIAELKFLKINSKIKVLKLNNAYVSKLELPHKVQLFNDYIQYFKCFTGFVIVAFLGILFSWIFKIYTEEVWNSETLNEVLWIWIIINMN